MNIYHFCFILFNLKIFDEIVTTYFYNNNNNKKQFVTPWDETARC